MANNIAKPKISFDDRKKIKSKIKSHSSDGDSIGSSSISFVWITGFIGVASAGFRGHSYMQAKMSKNPQKQFQH